MENEEAINYYLNCMSQHKKTKYIFWKIPFPSKSPILFICSALLFFALLGIIFGQSLLFFVPAFLLCWPYYQVVKFRNAVLDSCIVTEIIWQKEFREKGVDPNFPYDPLYVTEEDREDIFEDGLTEAKMGEESELGKIKQDWLFILLVIILYSVTTFVLNYLVLMRTLDSN